MEDAASSSGPLPARHSTGRPERQAGASSPMLAAASFGSGALVVSQFEIGVIGRHEPLPKPDSLLYQR